MTNLRLIYHNFTILFDTEDIKLLWRLYFNFVLCFENREKFSGKNFFGNIGFISGIKLNTKLNGMFLKTKDHCQN